MDQLAPIIDRAQPCALDSDCQPTYFCLGDAGDKRCLRADSPRCGDGSHLEGQEDCDDGNRVDDDACRNNCQLATCGDGVVRSDLAQGDEGYEACDDGNSDDTDACTRQCNLARCGDAIQGPDEGCDDGNEVQNDACTNDCRVARCGDGTPRRDLPETAEGFEECDDGNLESGGGCSSLCGVEACGNSRIDHGEACDDGNAVNSDTCLDTCAEARWSTRPVRS